MKLDQSVLDSVRDLGGQPLVERLFRTFVDHFPARSRALSTALEERDAEGVALAAHSLRSSTAMLGATEVSELAGRVESLADAGDVDGALEEASELERKTREFVARLEAELA